MENRALKLTGIFIFGLLFVPSSAFSYADKTTHPALTQETVEFFNYHYPDQVFSEQERDLLMQGSINEDRPLRRVLNHFYDPIYDRGLRDQLIGRSAKTWAQSVRAQARSGWNTIAGVSTDLFSADSDYSWERNIYEYVYGDKNRALYGLGHTLHLIQDATVPAHTRNDAHPPKDDERSPYEDWAAQFSPGLDITETLIEERREPRLYEDLDMYFNIVAGFSNRSFFSRHRTPSSAEYNNPVIDSERYETLSNGGRYLFGFDAQGRRLVRIVKDSSEEDKGNLQYILEDRDDLILSSYWNNLSREAVLNGAGVIKLFFDEVEKERETGELLAKNTSLLKKTTAAVGNAVTNTTTAIGNAASKVGAALGKMIPSFGLAEGQGASVGTIDIDNPLDITLNTEEGNASVVEDEDPQPEVVEENEEPLNTTPPQTQQLSEEEINRIRQQLADMEEQVNQLAQKQRTEEETTDTTPPVPIAGGGGAPAEEEQNTTSGGGPNEPEDITAPPALSVLTPEHNTVSTSTPVLVTGTSTEGNVMVVEETTKATTTADQNGDWSLPLDTLTQGTTTLSFVAEDQAGNKSEDTSHTLFLDTIGPTLSLSVSQCSSQSLFSDSCVLTEGEIDVVWQTPEMATTTVFTLTHGTTTTQTSATSTNLTLPEGVTDISVSTADTYGNIETQTKQVAINSAPVVINEVAWMGTEASSADEWVELYNTTEKEISLDGWHLRSEDGSPEVALTGTIEAGGYYLLERTDDDTISDVAADQIYTGALNNTTHSGDELYLQQITDNGTTTIDTAPARCGRFGGDWCAGLNSQHLSMERIDPYAPGTDLENWEDSLGIYHEESVFLSGTDADGNKINGTPKAKNTTRFVLSDVDEDIILTKEYSPYVVTRNGLEIGNGAELTIEPGVVIKVVSPNEPRILIDDGATLIAEGTEDEPIVFTAFVDDEYGGDFNKDGMCDPDNASSTAACPFPGAWKHLMFSESTGVLEHTIIRYSGKFFTPSPHNERASVRIHESEVTIKNSIVEHSYYSGISSINSTTTIENSISREDGKETSSCGVTAEEGTITITDSTFADNERGVCVQGTKSTIIDNEFIDNAEVAMQIGRQGAASTITGNIGEGNGFNAIGLRTGTVAPGESLVLEHNELPYLVDSTLDIYEKAELVFQPGTVIKFDDRDMVVEGTLKTMGTASQPVVFTAIFDDEYGGDVQGNGPASGELSPIDDGIRVEETATSTFSHTIFRYLDPALSYEDEASINLSDVTFQHNALGIDASPDAVLGDIENILFADNEATSTVPLIQTSTSTGP